MKKLLPITLLLVLAWSPPVFAQQTWPSHITLRTATQVELPSDSLVNRGHPTIISFWATWCKPCNKELDALSELYDEWREETGVRIYAIAVDDSRSQADVVPHANGRGWPFDVLLDSNQELMRALHIFAVPYTLLLDGQGTIVYQHNSYKDGDEDELLEQIKKLAASLTPQ